MRSEEEEIGDSPLMDRLMAIGLPVFAWAAFAAAFLKIEITPVMLALVGAAGATLVVAAAVASRWGGTPRNY